jgi:hypothetical protein
LSKNARKKQGRNKISVFASCLFYVSFLLGLIVYSDDGGDHTTLYCRRHFIDAVVTISNSTTKK